MAFIHATYLCIIPFDNAYHYIDNNFIRTIFSVCLLIFVLEKSKKSKKYIIFYVLWELIFTGVNILLTSSLEYLKIFNSEFIDYLFPSITGNYLAMEGGLIFLFLGVLLYYTKHNRKILAAGYLIFCTLYYIVTRLNILPRLIMKLTRSGFEPLSEAFTYIGFNIIGLEPIGWSSGILSNYQWLMVFALPFMLLYNNQKGKGIKYFFYVFYPLHILILYVIGNLIFNS